MATHMVKKILCQGCRKTAREWNKKTFSSYKPTGPGKVSETASLKFPQKDVPPPVYVPRDNHEPETKVTTLENGLRVTSEQKFGHSCTVGVLIDSGSRYEVNYISGINHFLEKLAYQKTCKFPSRAELSDSLEKAGGIIDCQASRDVMIYASTINNAGLETAMEILSEAVNRPIIERQELDQVRQTIKFEWESHKMSPLPEAIMSEHIFAAAYRNNTVGLPKLCPLENVDMIDERMLYTFMKSFYDPSRMVVAGVGCQHENLVELAQKYFVDQPAIWTENLSLVEANKGIDNSIAQYTGGLISEEADLTELQQLSVSEMPLLAHLTVGLESCSHSDPDFVPFCVLNLLLGGGGSFSAGGPGKGMYSRLYTNVLNRHHWIENATAFNQVFDDTGLFYIYSCCHPSKLKDLSEVISHELQRTAGKIRDDELERAKVQLQSMLLMNMELRPAEFEDVGRQVLSLGHRKQPMEYFKAIGEVTHGDMKRIAERMLRSPPAVAAYGSLDNMPTLDFVKKTVRGQDLQKRFSSIFGSR